MSEQLSGNHQQESSITEQLNADNANELSRAAFEQSGMSYMEWLDQGGYAGHLRRTEGQADQDSLTQDVPMKNERSYREARTETLSDLENDPDRVAEQVVTKKGDSWSYVRDNEGRKHRIGSQEAADLAQSHYLSLSEAEKAKVSGGKAAKERRVSAAERDENIEESIEAIRNGYIDYVEAEDLIEDERMIKASKIDPEDYEFWNALDSKRQEYEQRLKQPGSDVNTYGQRIAMIEIIQAGYDLTPENFMRATGLDPENPLVKQMMDDTYGVLEKYVNGENDTTGGTGFGLGRGVRGTRSDSGNAEIIPFPATDDPEGSDEPADVREPVNVKGIEGSPDIDGTGNENDIKDSNQENSPKRRGAWDEFRRLAAERMLPAGLAERLHNRWDSKEEGDKLAPHRKRAGILAALTFVTLVGGGIVNSSSPGDTPRDPGVTAGPEDVEDSTPDVETLLSPEVANFEYTIGEGHGATHMVHELAQTMGYELSNDELLEVANRNADSFLSEGLTVPMDVPKGGETGGFQEAGVAISAEAHRALFGSLAEDIKDVVNARSEAA